MVIIDIYDYTVDIHKSTIDVQNAVVDINNSTTYIKNCNMGEWLWVSMYELWDVHS